MQPSGMRRALRGRRQCAHYKLAFLAWIRRGEGLPRFLGRPPACGEIGVPARPSSHCTGGKTGGGRRSTIPSVFIVYRRIHATGGCSLRAAPPEDKCPHGSETGTEQEQGTVAKGSDDIPSPQTNDGKAQPVGQFIGPGHDGTLLGRDGFHAIDQKRRYAYGGQRTTPMKLSVAAPQCGSRTNGMRLSAMPLVAPMMRRRLFQRATSSGARRAAGTAPRRPRARSVPMLAVGAPRPASK